MGETVRVVSWLETVGDALLLQLVALVCSIPVVTAVPAAVAMQRSLNQVVAGEKTGVRTYLGAFSKALRQAWLLGVLAAAVAVGLAVSLPFWNAGQGPAARAAFVVLACLAGISVAFYLNLLSVAATADCGWWSWRARAFEQLALHPLRGLAALALFFTWLAVVSLAPVLLVVGSSLVPAIIVRFVVRESGSDPGDEPARRGGRTTPC